MNDASQINVSTLPQKDPLFETFGILGCVVAVAIFLATLYTAWSPSGLFINPSSPYQKNETGAQDQTNFSVTPTPRSKNIGIIAGHWGNDSGAVCADGIKEVEINLAVAALAQKMLVNEGIPVDLLKEKDAKLEGYNASILLSIHSDSCDYINDVASGFKVAGSAQAESSHRLVTCINDRYAKITGMKRHPDSITIDMTEYHAFDKINPETPAAIIEVGFMNLDRQIITQRPDLIAQGIVEGLKCFLNYGENELPANEVPTTQP